VRAFGWCIAHALTAGERHVCVDALMAGGKSSAASNLSKFAGPYFGYLSVLSNVVV